ncbi:zymogen granule membrane protein 16-like [Engraulis encrasicolus]|uniref:zymogen granule membrane protein 16-like n=1 Tax=Engraulis encrasicolus TaxID=184585 RepID=UPI002FD30689
MLFWLALCMLCSTAWTRSLYESDDKVLYSYSPPVGSASGDRFATSGTGRISAVRMWERTNNIVTGFQLKYGFAWTPRVGVNTTRRVELDLFDGEAIVQVSGKFNPNSHIHQLVFTTSRGRSLSAGLSNGVSFSHNPTTPEEELRILSGRSNTAGITALGAHWAPVVHAFYDGTQDSN